MNDAGAGVSDFAFTIGACAGALALAVWMLWPTKHRCSHGPRCPHYDCDYDVPL